MATAAPTAPSVTDTADECFTDLLTEIDRFLAGTTDRTLVPADEVQSFALDLRLVIMRARDKLATVPAD